ncbi:MAG: methyltransferase domain-containing protein, partial [Planctomycetes bacterium]|nr:methyltransferase domain-containing protein [Planctomycetota bacterium]
VAPAVALHAGLEQAEVLLDVGGGTGLYALACLERHPHLRAIVWDRPEVLKVAREMAAQSPAGDRLELRAGDMFTDPVPQADVMLLSNILHDWDFPECHELVGRLAPALPEGGRLLIHDVFLDDDLGGPLPIALYSARLFTVCAGRAYSGAEYREMLRQAGLTPGTTIAPTLADCGIITGTK